MTDLAQKCVSIARATSMRMSPVDRFTSRTLRAVETAIGLTEQVDIELCLDLFTRDDFEQTILPKPGIVEKHVDGG
ncbi:hypothetical protein EW146_g5080 [Bondarzewia mesenterica]|uniref:Uncharacterized protein n=1 Tax=Bondarzewia mesenterica TaxID=1095465 RepID=A0A4V3XEY3_9AGAM|nr:hypothetical protein EW146_g5080 [Bondarzewia mesenterica]